MSTSVTINPFTRVEGHLAIHTESEPLAAGEGSGVRVTAARCEGEMFRGFEDILRGRDPLDAQQIVQRICGVCPISHGTASVRAQEMAYGVKPNNNGRLLQNLIFAANYLQSHIAHFYLLAALDFVDVKSVLSYSGTDRSVRAVKAWVEGALAQRDTFAAAPFLPRFEVPYVKSGDRNATLLSHYVEALDMRRICHEMAAVFGGRLPHSTTLFPGGVSQVPTTERLVSYTSRLRRVGEFIDSVYLPDLLAVAAEFPQYLEIGKAGDNFLCFGVWEMNAAGERFVKPGVVIDSRWEELDPTQISEDVAFSRYTSDSGGRPLESRLRADASRSGAYSWVKAPRYKGRPMEVGPLARVLTSYFNPANTGFKAEADAFLAEVNVPAAKLNSVLGRHVVRGFEARRIVKQAAKWLGELEPDAPGVVDFDIPAAGTGHGLVEAPRGALGHWISIKDYHIAGYECIVPTTWNCSPRDSKNQPGPVEKALEGVVVADPEQPIELARIVRSFDPCLACAVH